VAEIKILVLIVQVDVVVFEAVDLAKTPFADLAANATRVRARRKCSNRSKYRGGR
jgi:hypothetical protein